MTRPDLSALHASLIDRVSSGVAATTIAALLTQTTRIERIRMNSYAHPNGFRKLVVDAFEDGSKLRVHHWPGDHEPKASNVHNHRWPFASVIMTGVIRSTLFVEVCDGEPIQRYVFTPGPPGGRYAMSPDGELALGVSSVADFGPGSSYALDAEQLHRVHVAPGTLSLVLSGPAQRKYTDVLRPQHLAEQRRDLPLLATSQVQASLELVAVALRTWAPPLSVPRLDAAGAARDEPATR